MHTAECERPGATPNKRIWTPPVVRKSDAIAERVDCSRISGPWVGA
jgi:hypothetical protein